jgi:hypothetical protein
LGEPAFDATREEAAANLPQCGSILMLDAAVTVATPDRTSQALKMCPSDGQFAARAQRYGFNA